MCINPQQKAKTKLQRSKILHKHRPLHRRALLRSHRHNHDAMAGPTTRARANWAVNRATSLPEVWAIVAEHLGLVGAWRRMLVRRAACAGAKEFLATLPGIVVCGGRTGGGRPVSDVRRLELATLWWEVLPSLLLIREPQRVLRGEGHPRCTWWRHVRG